MRKFLFGVFVGVSLTGWQFAHHLKRGEIYLNTRSKPWSGWRWQQFGPPPLVVLSPGPIWDQTLKVWEDSGGPDGP